MMRNVMVRLFGRRCQSPIRREEALRFQPMVEGLQARLAPAITASFSAAAGLLTVVGDSQDNTIAIGSDAEGNIMVNNGDISIAGDVATVENTTFIRALGLSGDDTITLDETNNPLPDSQIIGGSGDDTLTGGSGADELIGQSGEDILQGMAGDDSLIGGAADDTLEGGAGIDSLFGQAGDDTLLGNAGDDVIVGLSGDDLIVWNNGDGSDQIDGGAGTDTVEVNGSDTQGDEFTIAPDGDRVAFARENLVPFTLDIGSSEVLDVNGLGGDDTITGSEGLAGLIELDLDGGAGNDTIAGGDGDDLITGGEGDDTLTGNLGDDEVTGDVGDDLIVWNAGDGNDVIDGGEGVDIVELNGSDEEADEFAINADGTAIAFESAVDEASVSIAGSETLDVNTQGGDDSVVVGDLTGVEDVTTIDVDAGAGDDQVDAAAQLNAEILMQVMAGLGDDLVSGSAGDDLIDGNEGDDVLVAGPGDDVVSGGIGEDVIDGDAGDDVLHGNEDGDVINGGLGEDVLFGDPGDDVLNGDEGDDILDGGDGEDVAIGGDGDDTILNVEFEMDEV